MRIEKASQRHHSNTQEFITPLYQEYGRLLYFTVQKYNSNPQQCEDIVQDSLEKLIGKVDTLQNLNQAALASYIVVSARNTAINYMKRQGHEMERVISLAELSEEMDHDPAPAIDDQLIWKERMDQIRTGWSLLDEETKSLLERKYILGYDDKQLAKLLGCQPNSVRMKLTRAKRKAIELLKESEKVEKS